MKKMIATLLMTVTIVALSANFANATITALTALTTTTSSSVTLAARIQNSIGAYYRLDYGIGINVHANNTALVPFPNTVDDTVYVTITGLISGTQYSYQWQILGSTSATSNIETFTTDPCTFSPGPYLSETGTVSFCSGVSITAYPIGASYQWLYNGSIIPGATLGSYYVSASGAYICRVTFLGCTMETSATNVNIVSGIGFSSEVADTTVCDSSNVLLKTNVVNSLGVTYSWTPMTGLNYYNIAEPTAMSVTTPITYVGVASNGTCEETVSITIFPVEKPTTFSAELIDSGFVLNGHYEGLISSVWVGGHTLTPNPDYNTESYAVVDSICQMQLVDNQLIIIKTVSTGCSEQWHFSFLGIATPEEMADVKIGPNPFSESFTVSLPNVKCKVLLVNNFGQTVREMFSDGGNFTISGEGLSSGIYFLKVTSEEGKSYTTKVVKQ